MTTPVRVTVLLFARLRELAGTRSLLVELPVGAVANDAWAAVETACPTLRGSAGGVRVAVDEDYATWSAPLRDGAVVAFIPPVAGGADDAVHVRLTSDPLDARALEEMVRGDADGAVCTFTGVVRNHAEGASVDRLEYEAYPGMAEAEMRQVAEEALAASGAHAVAVEHRVGVLEVGEASVVVCASAAHRAQAFDACRRTIDLLKERVPIWKKEHGPEGATWVDDAARARGRS